MARARRARAFAARRPGPPESRLDRAPGGDRPHCLGGGALALASPGEAGLIRFLVATVSFGLVAGQVPRAEDGIPGEASTPVPAPTSTVQPYIDLLKRGMSAPSEPEARGPGNPDPYIQSIRKGMPQEAADEGS